jgi:hypothetical protein
MLGVTPDAVHSEPRITAVCEDISLRSVLQDVLIAYNLHAVVVFRPEDTIPATIRTGRILVKDVSPQFFFSEIVKTFPGYVYEFDIDSRCWFLAPDDGRAYPFQRPARCEREEFRTLISGVGKVMSNVSNSWYVPQCGQSISNYMAENDLSISSFHQQPYDISSAAVVHATIDGAICWKELGKMLSNESRSFLFVFTTTNTSFRNRNDWSTSSAIEEKWGGRNRKHFLEGTNYYWAVCKPIDCSLLRDTQILEKFAHSPWSVQMMTPQLMRMSEQRLQGLYKDMDPMAQFNLFVEAQHPLLRYSDLAIRLCLDWHKDARVSSLSLSALLDNAYSPEMQSFLTAFIAKQDVEWRWQHYDAIRDAPIFIPYETRSTWKKTMENGRVQRMREQVEWDSRLLSERLSEASIPSNVVTRLKATEDVVTKEQKELAFQLLLSFDTDAETLKYSEMRSKRRAITTAEHLRLLGINTNRSFSWVWPVAGLIAPTNEVGVQREREAHLK